MPYNLTTKNWESTLEYNVIDQRINLDKVLSEMKLTFDFIVSQVQFSDPELLKLSWGKTQTLGIKMID